MTDPIDHRARAEKFLHEAAEAGAGADAEIERWHLRYALVHATLAAAPVRPSVEAMRRAVEGAELAGRFEELRDAVRDFLHSYTADLDDAGQRADRLEALVR